MNQQEYEKKSRKLQYSTYEDIMEAFLICNLHELWSLYSWWSFKQFPHQALDWVFLLFPFSSMILY